MKRFLELAVLAFGFFLFAAWSNSRGIALHGGQEKPYYIPLHSIYVESDQEGVKHLQDLPHDLKAKVLEKLPPKAQTLGLGPSNLFLVRGEDIKDAVFGTWEAYQGPFPGDEPIDPLTKYKGNHQWLVVYFGCSNPGTVWLVDSVMQKGNTFRVYFKKGKHAEVSAFHYYFAWVPLGELAPGAYKLELFNMDTMQMALARTVTVKK
jgi:hypothetical protein